tara:strand:- start:1356 stop:3152 length:1797 start_codon:yes stop_codon:yes gene_type:complete
MATTIQSTSLDFQAIKDNLKRFYQQGGEFTDYNFEASGLSNILDVLAYNTHYNGLTANFALNESFLTTAQLRSSVVGLSTAIGYTPGSRTGAFALVSLSFNKVSGAAVYTMPAGFTFTATVDSQTFTFQTTASLTTNAVGNLYTFNLNGDENIRITEGVSTSKVFVAGPSSENDVYVIPDTTLDLDTATVKVYPSASSAAFTTYTNINDATTITEASTIYALREAPNGFFELSFSNGSSLGQTPVAGNKIEVSYLAVNGLDANGALTFDPTTQFEGEDLTVVTVANASAGAEKESLDSIRQNAPFLWGSQNRMVTAADYSTLILRKYSALIDDIQSWGGEDNIPANYGNVYISIKYKDGILPTVKTQNKTDIDALVKDLSIASFNVVFVDPIETFIKIANLFQFNPKLTTLSNTSAETATKTAISNYFSANLGGFGQTFRRSNMLTVIDDADPAILSSRAEVTMQQRLFPASNIAIATEYSLQFPSAIAGTSNDGYIITSSVFNFNSLTCILRNLIGSNVIQIISDDGQVIVNNVGQYNAATGLVTLNGFAPTSISGASYISILAVPANQGSITPLRNNLLTFDDVNSTSKAILTTST